MKTFFQLSALAIVVGLMLSGCYNDKSKRNIEFSANMYNSLPLEPYSQTEYYEDGWRAAVGGNLAASSPSGKSRYFKDGLSAQAAPEGTVPRSSTSWYNHETYQAYHIENNIEGYNLAGETLVSPLAAEAENGHECSDESFANGKRLFAVYCSMCHGNSGKGDGTLVKNEVFPPVPSYSSAALKELPVGKMFHTLTYGKGLMGSHASQITPQQRWEVICYIQQFQAQAN